MFAPTGPLDVPKCWEAIVAASRQEQVVRSKDPSPSPSLPPSASPTVAAANNATATRRRRNVL